VVSAAYIPAAMETTAAAAAAKAAAAKAAAAKATPGLYIAWGPWLDIAHGAGQLHKVGHTGDLGGRLLDSAYVTCFPPDHWRYVATFETRDKSDAHLLETAVLHCCRERRLAGRELVRLPAADIIAIAAAAATRLAICVERRDAPVYPARVRSSGAVNSAADNAAEPRWTAMRMLVENLTVREAQLAPPPENDFIDELLTMDFSAVVPLAPVNHIKEASRPPPRLPPRQQEDLVLDEVDDAEFAEAMGAVEEEIAASPFDIHARAPAPIEARDYQRTATALCLAELRREGKAILQMACRCGKTPVAFGVLRDFLALGAADERPINALYLVPGLSLLRQTAQKLASYGFSEPILLVGSDPRPVPLAGACGGARAGASAGALVMTTDPAVIRAFVNERGRRLVISTYQSSPQVPTDAFGLTIYDEAHRVCGGQAPRPFNHFVMAPRAGCRLFMTATPAYDPPSKTAITMKDRALFGGVAYRYHLRQGIAAGYVNDFRLEIIAAPAPVDEDAAGAPTAEDAAMPAQLLAAMAKVDKLLVFCRNIGHASSLCAALEGAPRPSGVRPFECLVAHSRMGSGGAAGALRRFATPGERAVLFNCRLFQEGVEIPALNAVFFAAPRHSPRDIIQSVCRPLNRAAGKPVSVVFLPVLHDPARRPDDAANLNRYASIIPFVDALLDEDPRLYEHLLDPLATPYPIEILGTHTLNLGDAASRGALLGAIRRAVRYGAGAGSRSVERLLRVENVPWDRAFAEIRRVVETCGRYPKTTDAWVIGEARVCLHRFYNWARAEFAAWRAGEPSKLEPHQIHDLLSLPHWEPFGVEGPYPWRICMEFLAQWLREHGGVAPMVEINKGGYIGLEATAIERLSGALTCVNQQDGKDKKGGKPGSGYALAPEKQADLERVCAPYGLRWRKERDAAGALVKGGEPTFIQEAYARFKAYYKAHGAEGEYIQRWYPGFPRKHQVQENLEVQEAGAAPPRWRTGRRARADGE
jgi:superfamily II DNA or RNA helicase